MARINNGFENINVELLEAPGNDLAEKVFNFSKTFESTEVKDVQYDATNELCTEYLHQIGRQLFPKYLLEGLNVSFRINDISRICLAQITREKGLFMSESSATRALTNNLIIPMNLYKNKEWMKRYSACVEELENLYTEMSLEDVPYVDSRYIMPHSQTICISYQCTLGQFIHSCRNRIKHGFCDEINYLYRLMRKELRKVRNDCTDANSKFLWDFILNKCVDDEPFLRYGPYNNDWNLVPTPENFKFEKPAWNDWRLTGWKMELQRLYDENKIDMLDPADVTMIESWKDSDLTSTFDPSSKQGFRNTVKETTYYERLKNEKRL